MTVEEYGRRLAEQAGPLTEEQIEAAARILAPLTTEGETTRPTHDAKSA